MRKLLLLALTGAALAGCATPSARLDLVQPYTAELAASVEPSEYPYVAEHSRSGRRLAFVAATHTVDRNSATHRDVRRAFDHVRPAAVIIEGIPSSWGENPEAVVELARMTDDPSAQPYARGEAGYAASLALAAGVPFLGGEPTEAERTRDLLLQGFDAVDVFHTDLLGLLVQAISTGQITGPADPRFDGVFGLKTVSLAMERENPPRITYEGFADWYLAQFGADYRTDPLFTRRFDPAAETLVGRLLRAQSQIRDRHLLQVIMDTLKRRERVLVVYGGTHRTTLARALTRALGPAVVWPGAAARAPASGTAQAAAGQ
jgi:hypothetical protein